MLSLTLQAQTPQKRVLGYLEITNTGTGTEALGHYHCCLFTHQGEPLDEAWVKDYPRNLGAWTLVRRALDALEVP